MENKIYLDRNENNYGPAPRCFEVLKKADYSKLSCYTRSFASSVKSILSERLAKEVNLPENRVLLGYGAEDLLKQAILCYLNKDEKLFIPSYSWWYYKELASEAGGKNVEYPLDEGEDSFHYNLDKLVDLYKKETAPLMKLFEDKGARIVQLDNTPPIEIVRGKLDDLLKDAIRDKNNA